MRSLSFFAPLALLLFSACSSPAIKDGAPSENARAVNATASKPLSVGFLIIDGVYNTELTAPFDILHHTVFHTKPGMRVFTVAPTKDIVTSFEGLRILPDYDFDDAPHIDVLVVPSAENNMDKDLENEELIDWVHETGKRAEFIMSLCDGAFVLAKAKLLDGRKATTFPSDIARMRKMFSDRVDILDSVTFVHDGPAITSVGGAQSFEPALYLCELLYGAKVTRGIARGLVIDWDLAKLDTHLESSE